MNTLSRRFRQVGHQLMRVKRYLAISHINGDNQSFQSGGSIYDDCSTCRRAVQA